MMNVNQELIEAWESGDAAPSMTKAEELARRYRVPLAALYMEHPPLEEPLPTDHRSVLGAEARLSPEARYQIRWARARRRIALRLLDSQPTLFPVTAASDSSPDTVACLLRDALGVSLREQLKWADRTEALREWRRAVEELGILVFQTPQHAHGVGPEEMRGFSLYYDVLPVIGLVGLDVLNGRIFTLAHELAHLAARSGGICDWSENGNLETFCNAVAGAVLVPSDALRGMVAASPKTGGWMQEDLIEQWANRFQVSRVVIVRRMLDLGWIDRAGYQQKQDSYMQDYQRSERVGRKRSFGQAADRKALSNNGYLFTSVVMDAYRHDRISPSDAAAFTSMRRSALGDLDLAVRQWRLRRT